MGYGAPQVVEGQPRQSLPFGLFSVLTLRETNDPHWANGIEWEALTCSPASGFSDPDCETEFEKFFGPNAIGEATDFGVYGSYKCGTPGGQSYQRAKEWATAHLLAREEGQAEAQVWDRLAAEATDLNPGGALDASEALAALENWIGRVYGSLGVIHGSRGAIVSLGKHVRQTGARLHTRVGTPIAAGGGYPGSSPAGAAPAAGEEWLFASPALFGYRGPVFDTRTHDQLNNDVYALAERQYVVGFDPCGVGAVRVNLA